MSHFGVNPGDMTQDEMHDRGPVPHGPLVRAVACPGCQQQDGTPDQELIAEQSYGCVFGCGHTVDRDTGMCPHCKDHSANAAECEVCGRQYEAWEHGKFAHVAGTPR